MKKGLSSTKKYAVAKGRKTGIFNTWKECQSSIKGYKGAAFKSFRSAKEAKVWLEYAAEASSTAKMPANTQVVYTDGACAHARAGVGVYFGVRDPRNLSERLAGHRQTNQRAELTAVLRALEAVSRCPLHVYSDSEYCVLGIRYRLDGWAAQHFAGVENDDLWRQAHTLLGARTHAFRITHVKAHAGIAGNERADRLAVAAIKD